MRIVLNIVRNVIKIGEDVNPMQQQPELHESVRRYLAEREIRYTKSRRSLVTAAVQSTGPASASEFHGRIDIPLSSLYRSLTVLAEAGVLVRHHDADGLARFELAEWILGHHHHVVCVDCGSVEDVEVDETAEQAIDDLAAALARQANYELTGHNLEVEGVCRQCRK